MKRVMEILWVVFVLAMFGGCFGYACVGGL